MKKKIIPQFFSFFAGVVDTADKHSFVIIFAIFRKNSKRSQWDTQRPGGHKKNLKLKISCQTPFKKKFCIAVAE